MLSFLSLSLTAVTLSFYTLTFSPFYTVFLPHPVTSCTHRLLREIQPLKQSMKLINEGYRMGYYSKALVLSSALRKVKMAD